MELGYFVSPAASRLATGKTKTVGIVVPVLAKWFFGKVIGEAAQALRQAGFDVLLFELSTPGQRSRFFASKHLSGRTDGILMIALQPSATELEALAGQGQAVALIGAFAPGLGSVSVDDVSAGRDAVRYLLNLGHERIAFIGILEKESTNLGGIPPKRRLAGYREALAEAGMPDRPTLKVFEENSVAGGASAMTRLLAAGRAPTAAFVVSDEMAFGALMVLRQAGLDIPGDFSVLGFDNHELAEVVGLTTMDHDVAQQGREGAAILLEAMGGSVPAIRTIPTRLVIRETTAPPHYLRHRPPETMETEITPDTPAGREGTQ
ncbi:HTH-type transcriptional repressor CytR [Paenarthrobacter nitroguajacolicus]|nr:HTH-type transcriptional repressor CytR [Paenarthrobacter nitroguajacolicus]